MVLIIAFGYACASDLDIVPHAPPLAPTISPSFAGLPPLTPEQQAKYPVGALWRIAEYGPVFDPSLATLDTPTTERQYTTPGVTADSLLKQSNDLMMISLQLCEAFVNMGPSPENLDKMREIIDSTYIAKLQAAANLAARTADGTTTPVDTHSDITATDAERIVRQNEMLSLRDYEIIRGPSPETLEKVRKIAEDRQSHESAVSTST